MNINERIGRDLKVLRKLWNIPQEIIAELIDIDQSAISKIESGKQELTTVQFLIIREWVKNQPNIFLDKI